MKNDVIFTYHSYKEYMGAVFMAEGNRGQLSRAAEAMGCQRSFLSRVVSEEMHLTPEHAFKLARFWKLPLGEKEYFQTLVEYERAGDPDYRSYLKQKLNELKKEHHSVQERSSRSSLSTEALQSSYFSSWIWSALHFLTSIPEYQRIEALENRLGLNRSTLELYLEQLAEQGKVEKKYNKWMYKGGEFHAPPNSPFGIFHHQNWRARAVLDSQNYDNKNMHYTMVQTLSRRDFERVKDLMQESVVEASRIAGPSRPEEGMVITCDVFKI